MAERAKNKTIGKMGENVAAGYLKNNGYEIIDRNYSARCGEIDIIAADSKYLIFVEVKTRSLNSLDRPCKWVDKNKQRKIIKTTLLYLCNNKDVKGNRMIRFDVIEVVYDNVTKSVIDINHLKGAFDATGVPH